MDKKKETGMLRSMTRHHRKYTGKIYTRVEIERRSRARPFATRSIHASRIPQKVEHPRP